PPGGRRRAGAPGSPAGGCRHPPPSVPRLPSPSLAKVYGASSGRVTWLCAAGPAIAGGAHYSCGTAPASDRLPPDTRVQAAPRGPPRPMRLTTDYTGPRAQVPPGTPDPGPRTPAP